MRIVARSSLAKNLTVKHNQNITKRGRANTGGLKISEYYGAIDELDPDLTPKKLVDAFFVVANVVNKRAKINPSECDLDAIINFSTWLNSALPYSRTGKYQRIKLYRSNLISGMNINMRNIYNNKKQ